MNLSQIFVALAIYAFSYISASTLVFDPVPSTSQVIGNTISLTVSSGATPTTYNAVFTDNFGNTFTAPGLDTNVAELVTPVGVSGTVTLIAQAIDTSYTNSDPLTLTFSLPVLSIVTIDDLVYGQAVPLQVNTESTTAVQYTASFTCTSGSYQITGLTTGVLYDLVPAGIYGEVVITVTATNTSPATASFSIEKPSNNIPPNYTPAHQRYLPSVYANMRDGRVLEIVEVKYLEQN